MRPCPTDVSRHPRRRHRPPSATAPTALVHCTTDFAGNRACTPCPHGPDRQQPAGPPAGGRRSPAARAGGGSNDFDLGWENPDQGPASPIAGASWRIVGPSGYDTGVKFAAGRDRRTSPTSRVPAAGAYSLQLWLRDEAGNEAPSIGGHGAAATRRRQARRSPSPTEEPRAAGDGGRLRRTLRARPPARSSTGGSTRRAGPSCRRSWCPAARGQAPPGRADARARLRHLRLPRRRDRRRRQHRLDDPARRRHPDGDPRGRRRRAEASRSRRRRSRGSSPACAAATAAAIRSPSPSARRRCSAAA